MTSMEPLSLTLKDGRTLVIREAEAADAEMALALVDRVAGESTFLTMEPGELGMTVEQEAAFFERCRDSPNQLYLLALVDGQLVGTAGLGASPRRRLRHRCVLGMSVRKDHWRLGIGRALLDALLGWARANPMLTYMSLEVREDNQGAIALYRALGFVEEGRLLRRFQVDEIYYGTLAMGLPLDVG